MTQPDTPNERIVRLEEQMKNMALRLDEMAHQGVAAAESRAKIYSGQEDARLQMAAMMNKLVNMDKSIEAIRPTTDEYRRVREQVAGAGRLGTILWDLGRILISAAAGAVAAWYTLTGRPPP